MLIKPLLDLSLRPTAGYRICRKVTLITEHVTVSLNRTFEAHLRVVRDFQVLTVDEARYPPGRFVSELVFEVEFLKERISLHCDTEIE